MSDNRTAFAKQYARDAKLRAMGSTPDAAYAAWSAKRASPAIPVVKGGKSARGKPKRWKRGDVLDVGGTLYQCKYPTNNPPWKDHLVWKLVKPTKA